jgi:predicted helicase
MVEKVGDRRYWEQWAKNVAEIAERQMERITRLIKDEGKHQKAFEQFLSGLRKNINPSISEHEAVEMLSQHIITKPVFDALFEGYSFVNHNPISVSMQKMLDLLEEQSLDKDTETLEKFYESVKMRAQGIDNSEGKQKIIIELYDKFFKTAFPKMVEKLGIVYTPTECVDFVIHSVNDVLKKEFGRGLTDENIHCLDPFTGTGTFITRLLQSGIIEEKDLISYFTNGRETSQWQFYKFLGVTFHVYEMNSPIGKANDLPMHFKVGSNEKALIKYENHDDYLCFWRCLAYYIAKYIVKQDSRVLCCLAER